MCNTTNEIAPYGANSNWAFDTFVHNIWLFYFREDPPLKSLYTAYYIVLEDNIKTLSGYSTLSRITHRCRHLHTFTPSRTVSVCVHYCQWMAPVQSDAKQIAAHTVHTAWETSLHYPHLHWNLCQPTAPHQHQDKMEVCRSVYTYQDFVFCRRYEVMMNIKQLLCVAWKSMGGRGGWQSILWSTKSVQS